MPNVMIVEDEFGIRRLLRIILEREGHTVTEMADGYAALQGIFDDPPDLVVSDVFLPGMDGIELLIEIREKAPGMGVVMMSGGGLLRGEEVLRAGLMLGATAVIEKPFSMHDFLLAVDKALPVRENERA